MKNKLNQILLATITGLMLVGCQTDKNVRELKSLQELEMYQCPRLTNLVENTDNYSGTNDSSYVCLR
jgi:hypothetical protein